MGYALRLLGRFELSSPSGETIDIAAKKNQALIALLALAGGEPVSRSRVCEVLWGDRDEAQARNSLRQALTALRKTFGDQGSIPFVVSDTGVTIDSNAVSADVWQFVDAGSDDTAAVGLWRGMFLDGLSITGDAAEDWLRAERQHFGSVLIERLTRLCKRKIEATDWAGAISDAQKIIATDPLDEAGHRALMTSLAASGERARALRHYQACCDVLKAELGIEPDAATQHLYKEIMQQTGSDAAGPASPAHAGGPASLQEHTTIAVLPFANLSGNPDQDYFADGITEDLITELARYRHLRVIGHRMSSYYRERSASLAEIGRELGANFLVEGSARRAGDRVRVAVQLIDTETGAHVWTDRFDREIADIFALQDEMVGAVVARLAFNLDEAAGKQRQRDPTTSSTAYSHFLRSRTAWRNGEEKLALACLKSAVEIDPDYGRAQAYLGYFYAYSLFSQAAGLDELEMMQRSRACIERALAADMGDPFILQRAAMTYLMLGEPLVARRYAETAASRSARDSEILVIHGIVVAFCGDYHAGLSMLERAVEMESRLPPGCYAALSDVRHLLGDYEGSLAALDKIINPPYYIRLFRASNLARLACSDEARLIVDQAPPEFDTGLVARSEARMCALPQDAERWLESFRLAGVDV